MEVTWFEEVQRKRWGNGRWGVAWRGQKIWTRWGIKKEVSWLKKSSRCDVWNKEEVDSKSKVQKNMGRTRVEWTVRSDICVCRVGGWVVAVVVKVVAEEVGCWGWNRMNEIGWGWNRMDGGGGLYRMMGCLVVDESGGSDWTVGVNGVDEGLSGWVDESWWICGIMLNGGAETRWMWMLIAVGADDVGGGWWVVAFYHDSSGGNKWMNQNPICPVFIEGWIMNFSGGRCVECG